MARRRGNDEMKKADLEKRLLELGSALEGIVAKREQLEVELKAVQDRVLEEGGEALRSQRERFDAARKSLEDTECKVARVRGGLEQLQKKMRANKKEQTENAKKLEETEEQIKEVEKKMEDLENTCIEIAGFIKGAKERKKKLSKELEGLTSQATEFEKSVEEIREKLDKLKSEKEERSRTLRKLNEEIRSSASTVEQIRKEYQEIFSQYDFIEELEAADAEKPAEEAASAAGPALRSKRSKMNFDFTALASVAVTDDLDAERLEEWVKSIEDIKVKMTWQQEKLKATQPNINAINEYKKKFKDFKDKEREMNEINEKIGNCRTRSEQLKRTRFDEFMAGFTIISTKLKETYQLLTRGGDAELELIDSLDPFNEGVVFSIRPPKKSWKQMSKLSGGEKTLSSLALVFALHYYKPTPLYFMDEIDAALDFKNVSIVGNYIKERTKNAQFIIISLRNNMFELSDKLIGVYKTFDTTKVVPFEPAKAVIKIEDNKEN
eukprot:TRINITY_DN6221_c0_g1_i4.p1 TRINITY_DN6221_c0_g1~~TRINITY_DN6221_c0_g1_i4.p1  ORF type:complete len:494 (-),score=192.72 TRINITY_DN6221_c0_g1_i4:140-1621(-)